jgi:hypothetical protein
MLQKSLQERDYTCWCISRTVYRACANATLLHNTSLGKLILIRGVFNTIYCGGMNVKYIMVLIIVMFTRYGL